MQFNRLSISNEDFEEAGGYLSLVESDMDWGVVQALIISAIVAYSRPFLKSDGGANKKATPQVALRLKVELSPDELVFHE
jgi:hypothetical protein